MYVSEMLIRTEDAAGLIYEPLQRRMPAVWLTMQLSDGAATAVYLQR
jgi:hypothetical protein